MAQNGDIYLGPAGSEILLSPFGRKLRIIPREIERTGLTASGRLVSDLIALKHDFEMPYSMIDGDVLTTVLNLFNMHISLTLLIYTSPTAYFLSDTGFAPIVKLRPIEREREKLIADGLWSGASLKMEEV